MNFLRRLTFSLWYLRKPPWDTGISPPELLNFIEQHPPGHALDLGCGTGTNVLTLLQHDWQVTGVDFTARAIKKAQKRVRQAGYHAEFLVDDVTDLHTLSQPYDLILDIGCFHGLPQDSKRKYLLNLKRLLAPGGYFLLYGFLNKPGDSGTGFLETDLDSISAIVDLVDRKDGTERGRQPSVWLTYHRSD